MSVSTIRKIRKNLEFINSVKPATTSPYRSTSEAIIEKYASREIVNFRTALNLVLKLSSKRPEVTAKKFNDYIDAIKPKITRATRYSVVVVGWPATHRSRHTPLKTDGTRMATSRWQL
jgi:hypothetical protein